MTTRLTIVAHRGSSALAPENTLAAFNKALDLGVDVIETDVRPTRDGVLVLFHDDDLRRLTGHPQAVDELEFADLRRITVGTDDQYGPQSVPRLSDLLSLARGKSRVLLDLKVPPALAPDLIDTVQRAGTADEVILGIHSVEELRRYQERAPRLATLSFGWPQEVVWATAAEGVDIVRLWAMWINPAAVARARRENRPVWAMCGAPNERQGGQTTPAELVRYRRMGVDGAILNDPRIAIRANEAGG